MDVFSFEKKRIFFFFKARVNLITCYMLFKITFLMRQPLAETQCDAVSDDVGAGEVMVSLKVLLGVFKSFV